MTSDAPAQRTWEAALGRLQLQVTRPSYDTWLRDTVGLELSDNALVVGVPTTFAAEWLGRRMLVLIQTAVASVARAPVGVTFRVRGAAGRPAAALAAPPAQHPGAVPALDEPRLNGRLTFDSFVVGACNRLAYAASRAVAEAPGRSHNPLYLYGPVGLGKTHLLHAIGAQARAAGRTVRYVTAEQFTNEYLAALHSRGAPAFRERYRSLDVLLLDDVQFLSGKTATQEGFLHTFNALVDAGRQVAVAADRPPASLPLLQNPLRSRLESGLLADLAMPDAATRGAILHHFASAAGVAVPDAVVTALAERPAPSVRALQASLNRAVALSRYTSRPLDVALTNDALACFAVSATTAPTPKATIDAVASHYNLPPAALVAHRRDRHASTARQVAMYLLHDVLSLTPDEIGQSLGGRDRTTVLYSLKRVATRLPADPPFAQAVHHLRELISPTTLSIPA